MSEDHKIRTTWHLGRALIGLVLIFIGLVYVGVYLGIFDWVVWTNVWRLWPLLLVGTGLGMMVQNKFSKIGVLFIFLILVLFSFWMLWQQSTFNSSGNVSYRDVDEKIVDGIEKGELDINLPIGDIRLSGPADTSQFLYGKVETRSIEHTYNVHVSGSTKNVSISSEGMHRAYVGTNSLVELQMSNKIPYEVTLDVGKADLTLDFTSLIITKLDIETGASTMNVSFSDRAEHVDVIVDSGASTMSFTAPENVGVKINVHSGVSTTNFEGLEKQDEETYASDGYESAEKTINIIISSGVSTINFSR